MTTSLYAESVRGGMKQVTIDFETAWDATLGFGCQTTQEYVMDRRFEVILVGIKHGDGQTVWHPKGDVAAALAQIDWGNTELVCQNVLFDGAILAWHYGHIPARYSDTISMANCTGFSRITHGASLSAMTRWLRERGHNIPRKGDDALNAKGMYYKDFTPQRLEAYAQYCMDDVDETHYIYKLLRGQITDAEMEWHDIVARMFILPQLQLDGQTVADELARVLARREEVRTRIMQAVGLEDAAVFLSTIRSNPRFAELLRSYGCEPPMKVSKKTGKATFAFAKTDTGMMELLEHPDENVRGLSEARLGLMSSVEVSRCERFLDLAKLPVFCAPYKVAGALTGRLGGADNMNLQNLPSGRKEGQSNALRRAIRAPEGHTIVVGDSGQIEVRILAYAAGQNDLLELFAQNGDPYTDMAATLYHRDYNELIQLVRDGDEQAGLQRQTGKVGVLSLGYGAGARSTQQIAKVQYGITLTDSEVQHLVNVYRTKNHRVPAMWNTVEFALNRMVDGYNGSMLGPNDDMFFYDGNYTVAGERVPAIRLPDGYWITLYGLRREIEIKNNYERNILVYNDVAEGRSGRAQPKKIWGGSATGLLIQGTAFGLMKYQGILLARMGSRPALNTHDEFAVVVPEHDKERALEVMELCMTARPDWLSAGKLPLKCSRDAALRYGDAK